MIYNAASDSVNEKTALLTLNSNEIPVVNLSDGTSINLPDHPWSRWYLKTHFKHLNGDERGIAWYLKHDPTAYDKIAHLLFNPRPYQILALNRMKMSNCALWLDMGLGKTFISIAFALWMYQQNFGNVSLILCPPSIFVTWKDDIKKLVASNANARIEIVHGDRKKKILAKLRTAPLNTPTFLLTTYETLENVRQEIQTLPIANIFFDESSKIKTWDTQRTQSAFALTQALANSRRFCLSGTPATKSPMGLFSQYEILGKNFSRYPSYLAFEKRFAVSKTFMVAQLPHGRVVNIEDSKEGIFNWLSEHNPPNSRVSYKQLGFEFKQKPTGPKEIKILGWHKRNVKFVNLEELHGITQTNAYTLYKTDVLSELPPKTRMIRRVELSADQRKAYNQMAESSRAEISNTAFSFHDSHSPTAKLHQIANGYLIDKDGNVHFFDQQPKLKELEQVIEELGEQKLVIWAPFRPLIAQISSFLRDTLEVPCLELHGGVAQRDREGIVHAFQDKSGPGYLVANPAVGGLGLNLVSAAFELFWTNWYAPDVRIQAEDRLWRIGQERPVTVMDFIARNTLEPTLRRVALNEIELERKLLSMSVLFDKEDDNG